MAGELALTSKAACMRAGYRENTGNWPNQNPNQTYRKYFHKLRIDRLDKSFTVDSQDTPTARIRQSGDPLYMTIIAEYVSELCL